MLHINLDRFADVNHLLDERGGDRVLQEVAQRLSGLVRKSDTAARLSADEFAILLADMAGPDDVTRIVTDIPKALSDLRAGGNEPMTLTASVGIALHPSDGETAEELFEHSAIAMHRAKSAGRASHCYYDQAMGTEVEERVRTGQDLQRALDRGEFVLFYQPQVDLSSGRVIGLEALIRWQHPDRGLVPPMTLLPIAESSGLIGELTVWVVNEACRQAAAWQREGLPAVRIAVNLSAHDFASREIVSLIDDALADSRLDARWLEVELTETAVVADEEATRRQLQDIRDRGVASALDDFGTGYSSLAHLREMPISRVKLDRSFVSHVGDDGRSAAIVGAMIDLVHALDLEVVAEGIETAADLAFLRGHSCDIGQGYLFSRPVPADECAGLLGSVLAEIPSAP